MGFKVGLALGGGAARGLAHLGVIKALVESNIPIDIISGTSIGAMIGAIYGANPDIDTAIKNISEYIGSPDFDRTRLDLIKESSLEPNSYFGSLKKVVQTGLFFAVSIRQNSFISEKTYRSNMEQILPPGNIEDCPIKLGLISMNLRNAKEEVSTSGEIIEKVMASCAIPGIFPPVHSGEDTFVDGSWINPIPVSIAKKLGAKFVIAVDVAPGMDQEQKELNGFEVTLRAAEGSREYLKEIGLEKADVAINVDLSDMHWADFSKIDMCIEEGRKTVLSTIDKIKKKLFWKRIRSALFF
ncbi:MAG: patatin-like phospholipase family protein [Proteobacteria bacterium]|nr:patatin-like phospholipase family protein [Pseudomonadota bacterium]